MYQHGDYGLAGVDEGANEAQATAGHTISLDATRDISALSERITDEAYRKQADAHEQHERRTMPRIQDRRYRMEHRDGRLDGICRSAASSLYVV